LVTLTTIYTPCINYLREILNHQSCVLTFGLLQWAQFKTPPPFKLIHWTMEICDYFVNHLKCIGITHDQRHCELGPWKLLPTTSMCLLWSWSPKSSFVTFTPMCCFNFQNTPRWSKPPFTSHLSCPFSITSKTCC